MYLFKLLFLFSIIVFFPLTLFTQIDLSEPDRLPCGTAVIHNKRLAENPSLQSIIDAQNEWAKTYEKSLKINKKSNHYIIPVVYHIIHNNGPENVSKAVIEASIQNLNDDFQKLNSDTASIISEFKGIAADCEIEFRLAHIDPYGNCTEGITRTQSQLTYEGDDRIKGLVGWNATKYLNIWVVETISSGAGGYAYYPGTAGRGEDGIVIRSAQLSNSLTHEVGHYLNLVHCWGNSNIPESSFNCNDDDGVADTPNTLGNGSCNTSAISCGSLDNVQNYMEYSRCSNMFTEGQKNRMHAALNSSLGSRNNLWTNSNLIATGTNDPYAPVTCVPIPVFTYDKTSICEGADITFTDNSYNATPTGWDWTFEGGTPNTSSVANPSITYNTAGVYGVTHEPSTSAGVSSLTHPSIITVSSLTADYAGVIVDGFEDDVSFNNDWIVVDPSEGESFQRTTAAAATGLAAVALFNFNTSTIGLEDELISPSYDLSTITNPTFKFKYAFAKKESTSNDRLFVRWSTNCGESWALKKILSGVTLETASLQSSFWYPSSNEWKEEAIDLSSLDTATNVRLKFVFRSGGAGNNLFIDDVNIDGVTTVSDKFNSIEDIKVYPNPFSDKAVIAFNLIEKVDDLQITLSNLLGEKVTNIVNGQAFNPGEYTLSIDERYQLKAGIYFLQFNADKHIKTEKIIIQ